MHRSVLLKESIDILDIEKGETFLDGTLGSAGHSAEVARRFGDKVMIVGLDRDRDAVRRSTERLHALGAHFELREGSFRDLDQALSKIGTSTVDAILLDLGISSDQFEASGRGFSFLRDEPLLMTMKESPEESDLTAAKILNSFSEEAIEIILRGFGEERYSRSIAREIVRRREMKPFETTSELVEAVNASVPPSYKRLRIHPATRTFQALRIATNEELAALEDGLDKAFQALSKGGRFAIISFHSLEDRIVKNFFRERAKDKSGTIITKKPIVPSAEEIRENPRARSAKLRAIEKI